MSDFLLFFAFCPSPLKEFCMSWRCGQLQIQEAFWIVAESDITSVMGGRGTITQMGEEKKNNYINIQN